MLKGDPRTGEAVLPAETDQQRPAKDLLQGVHHQPSQPLPDDHLPFQPGAGPQAVRHGQAGRLDTGGIHWGGWRETICVPHVARGGRLLKRPRQVRNAFVLNLPATIRCKACPALKTICVPHVARGGRLWRMAGSGRFPAGSR